MKNFSTAFGKGNLRPRERVLLLVRSEVEKDKTGKAILSDAEKHALSEGWRPENNEQVREYNRYNDGWRLISMAELDAQTIYLNGKISLLQASRLLDHLMFIDDEKLIVRSRKLGSMLEVDEQEALDMLLKHSGLELEYVIYRHTFEGLPEDLKQDILALCPDAKTETQYLDQEEIVASFLQTKGKLSSAKKAELADRIIDSVYREFSVQWDLTDEAVRALEARWFEGYFADIPNSEIGKKWVVFAGVWTAKELEAREADDEALTLEINEAIKKYAQEHNTDIRTLLKDTVRRWLDDGLFVKEYVPLCNSGECDTCNDVATKLPHREVFRKWMEAKNESRTVLQDLIDSGILSTVTVEREVLGIQKTLTILTGVSLYRLEESYRFADDFKQQVDDFVGVAKFILFLKRHDFLDEYASLLGFLRIIKSASVIYEMELEYKIQKLVQRFEADIEQLNSEMRYVTEKVELACYCARDIVFLKRTFVEDMLIKTAAIEPKDDTIVEHYRDELMKLFGDDFSL